MIKKLVWTIVIGIVTGVIGHRLFWMPFGLWLSILYSILTGLVVVGVLSIIGSKVNIASKLSFQLTAAVTGGLVVLFATSFIPADSEYIYVDCSTSTPTADKDPAGVNLWGEVIWLEKAKKDFTIQFKSNTPFKDSSGAYKRTIHSVTGSGKTNSEIARGYGRFRYGITCKNGNSVDPMLNVPPSY